MPELQTLPLGELLRRYRITAGLSQEDLAERAGLSVRGISDLERGRRLSPHMETVRMLAEGLELTADERLALLAAARPELQQRGGVTLTSQATGATSTPVVSFLPSRALPAPLTALVGREQLVSDIGTHMSQDSIRLVTLTGPGGVGKTRVSLDLGRTLAPSFAGGVLFVDLAPLTDAAQVGPAILDALDFQGNYGTDPLAQLIDLLRDSSILLILDNFERLLDAATVISQALAYCPRVSLIVTSRVRLKLRGEYVLPVPPLDLPQPAADLDSMDLAVTGEWPAIRLFVDRARESRFDFSLTEQNMGTVVRICRRLDGLPLAIELAASWLRILTPDELLDRLERRLPALGGGARDAPERQQTLRSTIAWSLENLSESEQSLFRQLAMFGGGAIFSAILSTSIDGDWDESDLLYHLSALVDNSLIRQSEDIAGQARYSMLETIREFGREQVEEHGEGDALRATLISWIRELAERAEVELVGPNEPHWRLLLTTEQANIRAALSWSIAIGDFESGLIIAGSLWRFWSKRGALLEGRDLLTRALDLPGEPEPALRSKALQALANMSFDLGDYSEAKTRFEASLAIRRTLPDRSLMANALNGLGLVAFAQGNLDRARELHRESLELSRETGSLLGIGNSLSNWADAEMALGNLDASKALQEEGLAVRRELGDENNIAYSLYNLGVLARLEERNSEALDLLQEAIDLFQASGDLFGRAYGLCDLGVVRTRLGDPGGGARDMLEAIAVRQEIGDQRGIIDCLEGAARIAAVASQDSELITLVGAASAARERISSPLTPAEQLDLHRWSVAVRDRVGDQLYQTAWERGRALSIQQAAVLASEAMETLGSNHDSLSG